MPIVTIDQPQVLGERQRLPQEDETPDPSFGEVVQSAFATQNSLGSLLDRGERPDFTLTPLSEERRLGVEPYDPLAENEIRGYEDYADSFIGVESRDEAAWIKGNIDRELEHRRTLQAGGWPAVAAEIGAGTLDPIFLPALLFAPASGAVRTSVSRATMEFAAAGGTGAALSEAALHATQETRTGLESTFNITGATLLSGVLGGASSWISRKEFDDFAKAIENEFADIPAPDIQSAGASAGAREVADTTLDEETLVSAAGMEKLLKQGSPLLRMMQSPSVKTRQVIQDLAESPLMTRKNLEGKASKPAVETLIKTNDARLGTAFEKMDSLYVAYRGQSSKTKTAVRDLFGERRRNKQLSFHEFREEIGKAMRRNDSHPIPEVQEAAQFFRRTLFNPHKKAAQELGLLPENVSAVGAPSYLTRVYDIEKIKAENAQFKRILTDWLQREGIEDRLEAQGIADDIISNIMRHPDGMIPRNIVPKAGPLKSRELTIEDALIEDFLESDIEMIGRFYNRSMGSEIELTARFGDKDMRGALEQVKNEYDLLIDKATNQKQRNQLAKLRDSDLKDLEAVRDRLVGTFGQPADPNYWAVRTGRSLRQLNFVRLLGGMTISAIPDLARPVMVHGLRRYGKALTQLATSPSKFKMAGKEVKRAGTAWDLVLNSRATSLAEIGDIYGRGTRFERGLQAISDSFGHVSLMAPWNAAMKQFAGVMTSHRMLEESLKVLKGKASKKAIQKLASQNIDDTMAARIGTQFEQFGERGDVWLAKTHLWEDREAARYFEAALVKEVDTIIVTPGAADRPLWMSTETGKLLGQFKSFAFAATNRVMLSGLQQRDLATLNGALLTVSLGAVTYGLKQAVAEREISNDPTVVITEALDRSGMFGYLFDVNNIVEKATRGTVGVSALTGGPTMSRYASRNVLGALLGPSADIVGDTSQFLGAFSAGDLRDSDIHAMRKLLPYQNLFYIRNLLNEAEKGVASKIGE